jgi:spartin
MYMILILILFFQQVGEWFYPLIPGASPVLHTSYGAYIFPDLSPEAAGM